MSTQSDRAEELQLVSRIAGGDKVALQVVFSRHHTRVFRFIVRQVRDASMAEELANEVFLDLWRQAGSFEGRSSLATWLLAVARNKSISALRKRREVALDDEYAERIEDGADNSEVLVQKSDKAEALRSVIERLSPEHKAVIDLVYYHEMSVREVGEVLSIPTNTVKTRVFHARKRLADMLEDAGVDRGWP
jgi:RNA polymerase sigma-70 factor, ECF subfamily